MRSLVVIWLLDDYCFFLSFFLRGEERVVRQGSDPAKLLFKRTGLLWLEGRYNSDKKMRYSPRRGKDVFASPEKKECEHVSYWEVIRCSVSKFTEEELAYLQTQRLGRLATVNERGEPQVAAVGFRYNPELDTIDIGGYDMANTQKFRNIARNGLASLLVDDVLPPWKTRSLEIRGHAQALPQGGQSIARNRSPALIRITPRRIIFWDATTDPPAGSKRNV